MIFNNDSHGMRVRPWTKWVSAHFPLYSTGIATRPARHDALIKNLSQDSLMEYISALRGVLPRSSQFYVGPRGLREEMIACPGPSQLSGRPHASSYGWQSVPSADRRTPVVPSPGSCFAILFWSHANGS